MLPTFVIGLREGLEAVLIISIIATFLRRNGASLRPMWIGVSAAVLLSIAVGVILRVVEQNLPQAEQEGMETVIGLVAVFFVTGMVLWMRTHARFLKRDLEDQAATALGDGTSWALVVMVFLSVLREGFETSVFLLATFEAASSGVAAAAGAVLGILVSILIGYGIYTGGVRLNLAKFFTITSVFLVFVAAGLVLSALRTAHEAGWVQVGQGTTVDLSWLAPTGSIRAALVSGVLGMPADPRVIELLGWFCYLVPVLAIVLWPARWRPSAARVPAVRAVIAGASLVLAAVLLIGVSIPTADVPTTAPLAGGGRATVAVSGDTATLKVQRKGDETVALGDPTAGTASGADTAWHADLPSDRSDLPARLTVTDLLTYTGSRIPVGLDIHRTPGPFDASWQQAGTVDASTYADGLVDAHQDGKLILTLTGGGLTSPRVMQVDDPAGAASWKVDPAHVSATAADIADVRTSAQDAKLWKHWFPTFLLVVALALVLTNLVARRRRPHDPQPATGPAATPARGHEGRTTHVSTHAGS